LAGKQVGEIIFWALIRIAVVIPLIWILKDYFEYSFWWVIGIFALYAVIIHPVIIQYQRFEEKNKSVITASLCSSCKHFEKSAVLCIKHDEHPTPDYIPCEGLDWEPRSIGDE
jgi:hypothetical protein